MTIERTNIFGNTNVGVYLVATDKFCLCPYQTKDKSLELIDSVFKVPHFTIIDEITVLGTVILANSNGIVLSSIFSDGTLKQVSKFFSNIRVARLWKEFYAIGNTGVTNDKKTIIAPIIDRENKKIIQDTLDTEIIQQQVGGTDLVGSLIVTTNQSAAVGPYAQETELPRIKELLGVTKLEYITVNRGYYFPASGIAVNNKGIMCGTETTGIELARIANLFLQ